MAIICRNCQEAGHIAKECPNPKAPKKCFNCGEAGHLSAECTSAKNSDVKVARNRRAQNPGVKKCFNCGEPGHLSAECTNATNPAARGPRGPRGPKRCYNCGGEHLVKECDKPEQPRACFTCGSQEHLLRDCPQKATN